MGAPSSVTLLDEKPLEMAASASHPVSDTAIPPTTPTRRCRRTTRETVEAELFQLRSSQSGFVKSESLRLNKGSMDDRDYDDPIIAENRRTPTRWRRKIESGNKNSGGFVLKMQQAARNARTLELRFIGRRRWWPNFGSNRAESVCLNSKTALPVSPSTLNNRSFVEDEKAAKNHFSRLLETWALKKDAKSHSIPTKASSSKKDPSISHEQNQVTENFPINRFNEETVCLTKSSQSREGKWKNFYFKMLKLKNRPSNPEEYHIRCSDELSCGKGSEELSCGKVVENESDIINDPEVEDVCLSDQEQKSRKNSIPVVATVASVALANVGIAVAIILI